MAWYNPFSWGQKTADNIFDKDNGLLAQAGAFIGNKNFTEEERAEYNQGIVKGVISFAENTMSENTERSKSRREIANLIVKFYLLWLGVAFGVWPLNERYAEFLIAALTGLAIGAAFTSVIIFHFGNYGLARYKEAKK
jgi:VIT1/CCC1 family predicted Fe2+/Mn2+ transporter